MLDTNPSKFIFNKKYPRGKYFLNNTDLLVISVKSFFRNENYLDKLKLYLQTYYNQDYAITCSSCRMALYYALHSLNLSQGDEVLMTPITIPDMLNMVLLLGLKPRFVDLNVNDHSVNLENLKQKVSNKTKVFLLTHISGLSQNLEEIKKICSNKKIFLIEDISQSHEATTIDGQKLGEFGDIVVCSLTVGKSISSFVGGVILTSNAQRANRILNIKKSITRTTPIKVLFDRMLDSFKVGLFTQKFIFNYFTFYILKFLSFIKVIDLNTIHHSSENKEKIKNDIFLLDQPVKRTKIPEALHFDISAWQARFAYEMCLKQSKIYKIRKKNAHLFFDLASENLKKHVSLNFNLIKNHNYYHIPLILDSTEKLMILKKYLLNSGIDVGGYSLLLCSDLNEFSELKEALPGADMIYKNSIFIPIDETLSVKEVEYLAQIFNRFFLELS